MKQNVKKHSKSIIRERKSMLVIYYISSILIFYDIETNNYSNSLLL